MNDCSNFTKAKEFLASTDITTSQLEQRILTLAFELDLKNEVIVKMEETNTRHLKHSDQLFFLFAGYCVVIIAIAVTSWFLG